MPTDPRFPNGFVGRPTGRVPLAPVPVAPAPRPVAPFVFPSPRYSGGPPPPPPPLDPLPSVPHAINTERFWWGTLGFSDTPWGYRPNPVIVTWLAPQPIGFTPPRWWGLEEDWLGGVTLHSVLERRPEDSRSPLDFAINLLKPEFLQRGEEPPPPQRGIRLTPRTFNTSRFDTAALEKIIAGYARIGGPKSSDQQLMLEFAREELARRRKTAYDPPIDQRGLMGVGNAHGDP